MLCRLAGVQQHLSVHFTTLMYQYTGEHTFVTSALLNTLVQANTHTHYNCGGTIMDIAVNHCKNYLDMDSKCSVLQSRELVNAMVCTDKES